MEYLKEYGITNKQIKELKDRYNDGIIEFISNNKQLIEEIIEYLYSLEITYIYELMINNIQIFLETKLSLQKKIKEYNKKKYSKKIIVMKLMGY